MTLLLALLLALSIGTPVFVAALVLGLLWEYVGHRAMWRALLLGLIVLAAVAMRWHVVRPVERPWSTVVAVVAVYAMPLVLAGLALEWARRRGQSGMRVTIGIGAASGLVSLLWAPFAYMLGCATGLWPCL